MTLLRQSTPQQEGVLQVSKWLKTQVLLDTEEMQALLDCLKPFYFFDVSRPIEEGQEEISPKRFLEGYQTYIENLKKGIVISSDQLRPKFSLALSRSSSCFYEAKLPSNLMLVRPIRPIIQLQAHYFFYSQWDGQFRPMVQGPDSISWGLQFSYPQLFRDPLDKTVVKVSDRTQFENTQLFFDLMQWMRSFTLPTPFVVNEQKMHSPIRIGRQALSWIDEHSQLKLHHISVSKN